MFRNFSLILAVLAWCCLVTPWQSCGSDCRDGALQPFGHGCHPDANAADACHCSSHDHSASVADDCAAGSTRAHQCEDGQHAHVIFQQSEPNKAIDVDDDAGESQAAPPSITIPSWARDEIAIPSPVHPPGVEPQRMRQLRVDILLI